MLRSKPNHDLRNITQIYTATLDFVSDACQIKVQIVQVNIKCAGMYMTIIAVQYNHNKLIVVIICFSFIFIMQF